MSMISEQVKELREFANSKEFEMHEPVTYGFYRKIKSKLFKAANTIEELSAKLKAAHDGGRWTLCSEKLPEAGKFYIVTYRFEDETFLKCHELYYGTADGKTEPGWYLDDDGGELYKPFEVTAWQPLPEPYSPQ